MFITLESEETVFILITFSPPVRSRIQSSQTDEQERSEYGKLNLLHFTLEENTLISCSVSNTALIYCTGLTKGKLNTLLPVHCRTV